MCLAAGRLPGDSELLARWCMHWNGFTISGVPDVAISGMKTDCNRTVEFGRTQIGKTSLGSLIFFRTVIRTRSDFQTGVLEALCQVMIGPEFTSSVLITQLAGQATFRVGRPCRLPRRT
jgi:hypothetical protein